MTESGRDALEAHVDECAECSADHARMARVDALLAAYAAEPVDLRLAARVLAVTSPHLRARARRTYARRVAVCLLLASSPLPAVVVYGGYVLESIYVLLAKLLPAALAGWVVAGYGAMAVLLLATTYAAIPVLVERRAMANDFP